MSKSQQRVDTGSRTHPGRSYPLGATVENTAESTAEHRGVNFCVYAKHAQSMQLLLFDDVDAEQPARIIELDARQHRSQDYWHVSVAGIGAGQLYAWRAGGPFAPERGLRFDSEKVLLDPYARAVAVGAEFSRQAAKRPGGNAREAMKGVVTDLSGYDWEGDAPLRRPFSQTIIYEMHVGGFTRHPSSEVTPDRRGTYAGVIDKIPYLVELGVTAVELMPVFQFDTQDAPEGRINYWGYSPVGFFAPHAGYASTTDPLAAVDEFRDMVKALHQAGIEVILDVVFNHTAEGGADGPTYSMRGLADKIYYIHEAETGDYADFTGCGNTLNANLSIVRRLILDSLRYWVTEMHVDGFRFDLASILSRDPLGNPIQHPPVVWAIDSDPHLAGTKLIAEAWDAAGLYQVGSFMGSRWKEWNGVFRDDVRRFVRGDRETVGSIASRFLASPDIYAHRRRGHEDSVNFIACHDGFTLNDLVSYEHKRNDANGENSNDGRSDNLSCNHGVEGPSDDPEIEALRERQIKNFFTLTLTALGTPMILMGDEMRRTQQGNNNPYCQDNEISWLDWRLLEQHADLQRFVRQLIVLRRTLGIGNIEHGMDLETLLETAELRWHGVRLDEPDWGPDSHAIAFTAKGPLHLQSFHLMISASTETLEFELPTLDGYGAWRQIIDTARPSPHDAYPVESAPVVEDASYVVSPRSIVILLSGRAANT